MSDLTGDLDVLPPGSTSRIRELAVKPRARNGEAAPLPGDGPQEPLITHREDTMGHDGRSRIRSPDTRAPMPPPGGKRGRPRGAQVARPRLLLADNNDRATIDEAVALLAKHPNARIYRQDATDKLVECRADTDGRVRLAPLGEERLAVLIGDVADTCAERERRSGPTVVAVRPPLWLLKAILTGAAEVPWPTLEGLALTPTMRPDGTILSAPGYDPSTRLFYAPDASYPPLIEHPTQADATAAIERLLDLFREFPFGAEHHRAAAVAAVMTLVLRAGIEGATPMFAIDATTPGSGKGLIASIAAMIATGRPADLERMPNEDELEKRLVSDLIAGRTMKILDNVTAALESNTLCAFITAYRYRSRILGASETVEFPQRMVLFATGNNLAIRGDMPRRVVRCYLAPNTERPEARRFKRADLIGFVRTCRTGFVRDILTVARAYITAGRPLAGTLTPTGSFEEWSSVVREPLVWLGLRDPWDGTQAELAGDPLLEDARELLAALATEFGATEFAPAELTDLEAQTCASETIRRIVAAFTDGRSCTPARALSDTFRGLEGRILGGRRLSKGGRGRKGQRWRIEAAAPTDDVTPPHTGVTAANPCATGVPARP